MNNNDSAIKGIINLRWVVFIIAVIFGSAICFSLFSLNMQRKAFEENNKAISRLQDHIETISDANCQLIVELKQLDALLTGTDTITSNNKLQQKIDSLERVTYYYAVSNQLKAFQKHVTHFFNIRSIPFGYIR